MTVSPQPAVGSLGARSPSSNAAAPYPIPGPVAPMTGTRSPVPSAIRSRLAFELRAVALDMAGTTDRDELTRPEEADLADAIEAAVASVLPGIVEALDDALTPRIETLPLRARLVLARARARREFGHG